jgi:hypothetical protein
VDRRKKGRSRRVNHAGMQGETMGRSIACEATKEMLILFVTKREWVQEQERVGGGSHVRCVRVEALFEMI